MMFFYLILFLHTIIKVDKTLILQQLWKIKELKRAMNISTFLFIPIFFLQILRMAFHFIGILSICGGGASTLIFTCIVLNSNVVKN